MPLQKFLDLLLRRTVYFASVRQLRIGDPFEGYYSVTKPEGTELPADLDFSSAPAAVSYVSCWHSSVVEPAGLWKVYSDPVGGVAIQSSKSAIQEAFAEYKKEIIAGLVRYDDGQMINPDTMYGPVFRKRPHFAYENEARLCIRPHGSVLSLNKKTGKFADISTGTEVEVPLGERVPCRVETLIERIVVGPKTDEWMRESISTLMHTLGYALEAQKSEIPLVPIP